MKMVKKKTETEEAEGYENYIENIEKGNRKEIIVIAGRRIEVYNQVILEKFQRFDQIEIHVLDSYLERALFIIKQWEAVGIMPVNGYPIKFEKTEEDILSKDKKESYRGYINKIILTKQPEQFRFTQN